MLRFQKITFLGCLMTWAFCTPYLNNYTFSIFTYNSLLPKGLVLAELPTLTFGASFVVALGMRPYWLRAFMNRESSIGFCVLLVWAVVGTALGLVLNFFLGTAAEISRFYPIGLAAVFGFGLSILTSLVVFLPKRRLAATFLVLCLLAFYYGASLGLEPIGVPLSGANSGQLVLLSFALAFILSTFTELRLLGRSNSFVGGLFRDVFWIIAIQIVWINLSFLFGVIDGVPRWLPIIAAFIMLLPSVIKPFLMLKRGQPLFSASNIYDLNRADDAGIKVEFIKGTGTGHKKRAWIISYTGVSNEPRVLRQAEALISTGWDVVVCGYDGHSKRPDHWHFLKLPTSENFRGRTLKILSLASFFGRRLAASQFPEALRKWGGRLAHASTPLWLHTRLKLMEFAKAHPDLKADLIICHDYHTADVGFELAQIYNAKFSIDVHEYAAGQYFNDPKWVKWQRPVTIATQQYYLSKADIVTVVCEGIGRLLGKENSLKTLPVTIRSVPFLQTQPLRPTGERIRVLYHGDISPRREILALVQSMKFWRDDIDLVLRGASDPAYMGEIKRLIAKLGLEGRVNIEGPVPFDQIVSEANKADIGFFSFKGDSPQIRFTLPNKFFEYIMAGLCLVVGDTDEVTILVKEYGLGRLVPVHTPEAIAATINSLTREDIDAYKKASIHAALRLNWEEEQKRMLHAYEDALA